MGKLDWGYFFNRWFELAARYQELDPDTNVYGNRLRWTSVGFNPYIREHNLKIQTDYTSKSEQANHVENDMFRFNYNSISNERALR